MSAYSVEAVYLTMVLFFISIGMLCYLYFWLYKDYVVDSFRQSIFELRDRLFDEAHEGLIDFNHPAYCVLRRTMNGSIRFAHGLSLVSVLTTSIFCKDEDESKSEFQREFNQAIQGLDEETRQKILEYRKELNKIYATHIARESILFVLIVAAFLVIPATIAAVFYRKIIKKPKDIIDRELNALESTALAVGKG